MLVAISSVTIVRINNIKVIGWLAAIGFGIVGCFQQSVINQLIDENTNSIRNSSPVKIYDNTRVVSEDPKVSISPVETRVANLLHVMDNDAIPTVDWIYSVIKDVDNNMNPKPKVVEKTFNLHL